MRLSSHPNVLSCFATFVHSTDLWLVTQLMRKGSSLHCLQQARRRAGERLNKTISIDDPSSVPIKMENHILYIMHETLLGLQYIHEHNGQIHRDIKAGNILIDSNGAVRIADFGVSGWLVNEGTQQEKAKTFVGTPCWMVGAAIFWTILCPLHLICVNRLFTFTTSLNICSPISSIATIFFHDSYCNSSIGFIILLYWIVHLGTRGYGTN